MTGRKLFISHSSKTPENLALMKETCALLGPSGKGFHVLVDQAGEIPAGADWELMLNEWMAECHAAVILFSQAALHDSDWVKKEAAILSWRREVEDGFRLIPVLLDDLTPEDLTEGLFGVPTGPDLPDGIEASIGAKPLLPPLDLQVEEDQLFAFDDASRFIEDQLYGSP